VNWFRIHLKEVERVLPSATGEHRREFGQLIAET
jgi:hypothetical protein